MREFKALDLQEAFKSTDDTEKHFTVNRDLINFPECSVHRSSALWADSEMQIS